MNDEHGASPPSYEWGSSKSSELYDSLIFLADSLVNDFDVVDLLNRLVESCISLLEISSAGILLRDQRGSMRVLASSSEETRALELLELQGSGGPCTDAVATSSMVIVADIAKVSERWPAFTAEAQAQGIQSAYALPLRLRGSTIGALNLFCIDRPRLSMEELRIAEVLSNMATIGILNQRLTSQHALLAEQLQVALNSRITIEQAKGVIAQSAGVNMTAAFELLRDAARSSRRPLTQIAEDVANNRHEALPPLLAAAMRRNLQNN